MPRRMAKPAEALTEVPVGELEVMLDETVRRWLVAVQLLVRAEESASRGTAVDESIALILADDASEALLSLLASHSGVTPSRNYDTLVNQAIAAVKDSGVSFPPGMSATFENGPRGAKWRYSPRSVEPKRERDPSDTTPARSNTPCLWNICAHPAWRWASRSCRSLGSARP
jgi:hypothetical protein